MDDHAKNTQNSKLLAELISAVLVYWSENECFITDRKFSYYKRDELQLDFNTAENLVINFNENCFPEREELFSFIDAIYDRWLANRNIKKHYENFIELISEISSYKYFFDIYCLYAYQHEEDICICEDFYDREEKSCSLDKYITDGEVFFQDNEIIFDGFDLSNLTQRTRCSTKTETTKEVVKEVNPLEIFLEQHASSKKAKKLTNIYQNLMGLEYGP